MTEEEMRMTVMHSMAAALEPHMSVIPMPVFFISVTELLASIIAAGVAAGADEEKGYELVDMLLRERIAKIKKSEPAFFDGHLSPSGWSGSYH